jgi:cation transport ATPase
MLTGESMPVTKSIGDRALGGTVALEGTLHVRVTKGAAESVRHCSNSQ